MLDLGRKIRAQGFDYAEFYRGADVTVPTPRRGLWKWGKHVVNTGMAAKAGALSWRLDQRDSDRAFAGRMIDILDRHHGQVTGMFTGDECLAGKNPVQGTELCAVVEFLYSLEPRSALAVVLGASIALYALAANLVYVNRTPGVSCRGIQVRAKIACDCVNSIGLCLPEVPAGSTHNSAPASGPVRYAIWMQSPRAGSVTVSACAISLFAGPSS